MFTLAAPAFLWGAIFVSLPLIAHVLNRRARRRIVFPSIRLLAESASSQTSLFRLRRVILLLLRLAAVAMLVLAFARPSWLASAGAGSSGAGTALVVVVDVSASTGQRRESVPLVHRLRAAGQRALDELESGVDVADVVIARASPEAIFDAPSPNLPALRDALGNIEASDDRCDLGGAIALAGLILSRHEGPRRLLVLSDGQMTNWRDILGPATFDELVPSGTEVLIPDAGAAAANVALSNPRLWPDPPLRGRPVLVGIDVSNPTDQPRRIAVRTVERGTPVRTLTLDVGAHTVAPAVFEVEPPVSGAPRTLTIEIDDDALLVDNQVAIAIAPAARVPIVVLGDDDPRAPGSAAFFLLRAAAPFGDERDEYDAHFVTSADLVPASLAGVTSLIVGDIASLTTNGAAALLDFVRGGGSVLWFAGSGPAQRVLADLDRLAGDALLPWTVGPLRLAAPRNARTLADGAWRAPALRAFDERARMALERIRLERTWDADQVRAGAQVLLEFDDGTPALGATALALGRFTLAGFSPAIAAGDLGRHGTFVALLQGLLADAHGAGARESPVVGGPLAWSIVLDQADVSRVRVLDPDGNDIDDAAAAHDGERAVISVPRTRSAGLYQVVLDDRVLAARGVTIDPRESDLAVVTEADVLASLPAGRDPGARRSLDGSARFSAPREQPLWGWAIAVGLLALALEMAVLTPVVPMTAAVSLALIWRPVAPPTVLLAAALVLTALAIASYINARAGAAGFMLLCMRLVFIAAVTAILFGPSSLDEPTTSDTRPELLILLDTSASMATDDCRGERRIDYARKAWLDDASLAALGAEYDVRLSTFDTTARARRDGAGWIGLDANGSETRLVESVARSMSAFRRRDDGRAIVLLSDGHDTAETPIEQALRAARAARVPVHTVCLGGGTLRRDAAIVAIPSQEVFFAREPGEILVRIHQAGITNESSRLTIDAAGATNEIPIMFDGRRRIDVTIPVEHDESGLYEYIVRLDPLDGEHEERNNEQRVFVDVSASRIRVLVLEGQPFWDTKFLAQSLRTDERVALTQITQLSRRKRETIVTRTGDETGETPTAPTAPPSTPTSADEFAAYDVVILGTAIENALDLTAARALVSYVEDRGGRVVFARGPATSNSADGQRIGAALDAIAPVRWGDDVIDVERLSLTPTGATSGWMQPGAGGIDADRALLELPAFSTLPEIKEIKVTALVHARAVRRGEQESDADRNPPAILSMEAGRGEVVALTGEGLWRWRLLERDDEELAGFYDAFWSNLVRWTALGGAFQPGRDVTLRLARSTVRLGDPTSADIVFRSAPATAPTIDVTDSGGAVERMTARRIPGREHRYRAEWTPADSGPYRVTLAAEHDALERAFTVYDLDIERLETSADPLAMRMLAEGTNGIAFTAGDSASFRNVLVRHRQRLLVPGRTEYVWDRATILIMILTWIGLEWILRRKAGLL